MGETLHGIDAECPEDLKPGVGKIFERVAESGILPIKDKS